ncbi:hypothetical protein [Leptolyngbya sp. 7M]|uniref:hypothetical protein n=1 Tax=Leptolyngbya sp. 7M TaxID=2812896 RepID=UPI001B8D70FC|nr:hypothetical protein [Leptolyngbya sp. 7M]QYO63856.1 hypothetical protein JVX88_29225 [Leptolyngbya sp. 7M]
MISPGTIWFLGSSPFIRGDVDVIGLAGVSGVCSIDDLSFTQSEMGAVISAMGQEIATLNGINVIDIGSNSFTFA